MKETLEDPAIYTRAIERAIQNAAPMRRDETMDAYGRRVADFAIKSFEDEIDMHNRRTRLNETTESHVRRAANSAIRSFEDEIDKERKT